MIAVVILGQSGVGLINGQAFLLGQSLDTLTEISLNFFKSDAAYSTEIRTERYIVQIVQIAEYAELAESRHTCQHGEFYEFVASLKIAVY